MPRRKIVAGNWKMNLNLTDAQGLASEISNMYKSEFKGFPHLILAPPFPFLTAVGHLIKNIPGMSLAAQNVHSEEKGAFTGEVSPSMLSSAGCDFCLIGHSERRQYFAESNDGVLKKARLLIAHQIQPILCLGESLNERESGNTFQVIGRQVTESVLQLSPEEINKTVLAYEPVWAIGTGKTASPEQAQEVHAFIRNEISRHFGTEIANNIPILYGGSVTASNAKSLFSQPDIDGGLVGGASLKSREFIDIAKAFS